MRPLTAAPLPAASDVSSFMLCLPYMMAAAPWRPWTDALTSHDPGVGRGGAGRGGGVVHLLDLLHAW